ncbi:MAG: tryptophan--tRNA ligase [bacterium]|nr:tryptophan--tRNA ligase [bacterium]
MKHIVFSGIQPSGKLHIGNYFGAIKSWLELQKSKDHDCIFAIVDYHALTESPDPKELEQRIFDTAVDFLAAGLDPNESIIMLQSLVSEHTELAWILNCTTSLSWLQRVPTFKEKAEQFKNNLNVGLLDYPVLMAADILLYKADIVPVGHDQLAHLELAREIARSFNAKYSKVFVEPKEKITPTPKIMGLVDPTKKMSKSLGEKSYLALSDEPAIIEKKIKSMPTATGDEKKVIEAFLKDTVEIKSEFKKTTQDNNIEIRTEEDLIVIKKRLGESNYKTFMALYNFYMLLYIFAKPKHRKSFIDDLEKNNIQFSEYKNILAEHIINFPELVSFRENRKKLIKDPKKVEKILKDGSQKAKRKAHRHLTTIKQKIGIA